MTYRRQRQLTTTGLPFRTILQAAAQAGTASDDIRSLCRTLEEMAATGADGSFPVLTLYQAWHRAQQLTGEALLGLHMGRRIHPSNFGLFGYALMNCEDVEEVIHLALRFDHMGNRSVSGELCKDRDSARVQLVCEAFQPELVRPWMELCAGAYLQIIHHRTK
jgi:hypothetical protein